LNELKQRDKTLESLIRSLGIEDAAFYLCERYGLTGEEKFTIASLGDFILGHDQKKQIAKELEEIRTLSKGISKDQFREMAIEAKVPIHANDRIPRLVMRAYLQDQAGAETISQMAQAVNEVGFDEIVGLGDPPNDVGSNPDDLETLQSTLRTLLDEDMKGQKCIVKVRLVEHQVVMIAYIEDQQRRFFQAGDGDRIEITVVKPLSRTTAIYDVKSNRLRIRVGNRKRLKNRIAQSFGRAFFKNNDHFVEGERSIYHLQPLEQGPQALILLPSEFPEILGVRVVEETVSFSVGEYALVATFKGKNVEAALPLLSNDQVDMAKVERLSVTFEFEVQAPEGTPPGRKPVPRVTVTRGNRISHDPRYHDLIHAFLRCWGMETQ
jgi:hypothetical protein